MEPMPEVDEENTTQELVNNLTCGDIHPNALGLSKILPSDIFINFLQNNSVPG